MIVNINMENENIKNILELIKTNNIKNKFPVYLPSIEREVDFIPLKTEHQQTFVQNLLDSPFVNSPFTISFAKSIGDCWVSEDVQYNPAILTTLDKTIIMRELWIHSFSNETIHKIKNISRPIIDKLPDDVKIVVDSFEIVLGFPSILKEAMVAKFISNWLESNQSKINLENIENSEIDNNYINKLNGLLYVIEPLGYIKSLKIGDVEIENYNSLTIDECVEVVSKLPVSVTSVISNKVQDYFAKFIKNIKTINMNKDETIVLGLTNSDFVSPES